MYTRIYSSFFLKAISPPHLLPANLNCLRFSNSWVSGTCVFHKCCGWLCSRSSTGQTENPFLVGEKMSKREALKELSDHLWEVWFIGSRTLSWVFQLLTVLGCVAQNKWASVLRSAERRGSSRKKLARFHCVLSLFQPCLDVTTIYFRCQPLGVRADPTS